MRLRLRTSGLGNFPVVLLMKQDTPEPSVSG